MLTLTVSWLVLGLVGLVPATTRRPLDALARTGWRASHLWSLGILVATATGVVGAHGLRDVTWWAAVLFVALGQLCVVAVLTHRLSRTLLVGPHGSGVLPPVPGWWREVDGSGPVAPDPAASRAAVAELRERYRRAQEEGRAPAPTSYRPIAAADHLRAGRSWRLLAAAHGWRLSRPGIIPLPHWSGHEGLGGVRGARSSAPVTLTLSGRVGPWHAWVLAGRDDRATSGLVVAVWMPGAAFPTLAVERRPGAEEDEVRTATQDAGFRDAVLSEQVWVHLGATLPSYAQLLIAGDLLTLGLRPDVEAEPWRADVLMSCLLGLADLLPPEVVLAHLPGDPGGHEPTTMVGALAQLRRRASADVG